MSRRARWLLVGTGVGILALLIGGRVISEFYTNALWFSAAGFADVFWTRLGVITAVRAVAIAIGVVVILLNLWWVVRRLGPVRVRRRYGNLEIAEQIPRRYVVAGVIAVALLTGWWLSGLQYGGRTALATVAWLQAPDWGLTDPLFSNDLSFYVFTLPVAFRLIDYLLLLGFWSAILVAFGYTVAGSIRWQQNRLELGRAPRLHLAAIIAALIVLFGVRYWLGRYGLLFDGSGIGGGLGYTDVNARLPARLAVAVLAFGAAASVMYGARRANWAIPVAGIGALLIGGLLAAQAYPLVIQRFQVEPNELEVEQPYISWNLDYTRHAYGLADMERRLLPYRRGANQDWQQVAQKVSGLSVWDSEPLQTTFNEIQSIFGYYRFPNIDYDRYGPVGEERQVALGVREFSAEQLPENARTWQTLRLNPRYVRAKGIVASPADVSTDEGQPVLWVRNIEPVERSAAAPVALELDNPNIYFAETMRDYVILIAGRDSAFIGQPGEDFPAGIRLSSPLRTFAFAWRFGEKNILFSGEVDASSRIVFRRSLHERLRAIAPFVLWDGNPYPVVQNGRVVWIVDGYTAASTFPLSRPVRLQGVGRMRYLRNSVKASIDAVTGRVQMYATNSAGPVLEAYRRVFPELIRPLAEMPATLQGHLRYPALFFNIQAEILQEYHLRRANAFYAGEDVWQLASEFGVEGGPRTYEPLYIHGPLPNADDSEFLLVVPFIARERRNMTALLIARNDPPAYGELILLELPRDQQIPGPSQVEALIEQDPTISSQLSLWRRAGSDVDLGRLRVMPLDSGFLYVEPMFLSAQGRAIPELRRVVASDGESVIMRPTLAAAVEAFGTAAPEAAAPVDGAADTARTLQPGVAVPATLPRRALEVLNEAEARLQQGDWSGFGQKLTELRELLREPSAP